MCAKFILKAVSNSYTSNEDVHCTCPSGWELDNEQERNCIDRLSICAEGFFSCRGSDCIKEQFVCDGNEDCMDGTDENSETCSDKKCDHNMFNCGDGTCIDRALRCNQLKDCDNGFDEEKCPTACAANQVRSLGKIIFSSLYDY